MISPIFGVIWREVPFSAEHLKACCFLQGLCKTRLYRLQMQAQSKMSGILALGKVTLFKWIACGDTPRLWGRPLKCPCFRVIVCVSECEPLSSAEAGRSRDA